MPIYVSPHKLERIKTFAALCAKSTDYSDSKQSDKEKTALDNVIGRIGEEAVVQYLRADDRFNVTDPDYTIYKTKNKSWDSDLTVIDLIDNKRQKIAVKSQSHQMASRFGLSWIFQYGGFRKDLVLEKPNSWVFFVEVFYHTPEADGSIKCKIHGKAQIKHCVFGEPKLEKLKKEKKVVYADTMKDVFTAWKNKVRSSKTHEIQNN